MDICLQFPSPSALVPFCSSPSMCSLASSNTVITSWSNSTSLIGMSPHICSKPTVISTFLCRSTLMFAIKLSMVKFLFILMCLLYSFPLIYSLIVSCMTAAHPVVILLALNICPCSICCSLWV